MAEDKDKIVFKKISQLDETPEVYGPESVPIAQNGRTVRVTFDTVVNWLLRLIGVVTSVNTIADLQSMPVRFRKSVQVLQDGVGGFFKYSASGTPDNVNIFSASDGGVWIRTISIGYSKEEVDDKINDAVVENQGGFLHIDKMSSLKTLSLSQVDKIKNGVYRGVVLHGYYIKGDKPVVYYYYKNSSGLINDDGYIIKLGSNVLDNHYLVAKVDKVTYADYGANNTDDTLKVKKAHEFANENNLPVESHTPVKLVTYSEIEVKTYTKVTNVIIDETNRRSSTVLYHIKNDSDAVDVELTQEIIDDIIDNYKTGSEVRLTSLASRGLNQHYIIIQDNNRVVNRSYGSFKYIRDMFVLDKDGIVVGKPNFAPWTGVTSLVAYRIPKKRITVDFEITLVNSSNSSDLNAYLFPIISAQRSNTDYVFNFFKEMSDTQVSPSNGHISFNNVCKITANGKSFPLPGVNHGTYGIGGDSVFDAEFKVNGTGSENRWGIWGTNNFKNITFNKCNVNRLDVHFNAFNIYIQDCNVGSRGIHLTGGGDLYIDNTTVSGTDSYLNLREDYGSKWDGDIKITNAKYNLKGGVNCSIIKYSWINFNYNTEVIMAREIIIDNVKLFSKTLRGTNYVEVIRIPNGLGAIPNNTNSPKAILPNYIKINNIQGVMLNRSCRIMQIFDTTSFASLPYNKTTSWGKEGYSIGQRLVEISGVDTNVEHYEFLRIIRENAVGAEFSPEWNIKVEDCGAVSFEFKHELVNLTVDKCIVYKMLKETTNKSFTKFNDCLFISNARSDYAGAYKHFPHYTYFNRCTLTTPNKSSGAITGLEISNTYSYILQIPTTVGQPYQVFGNHVHTKLTSEFNAVISSIMGASIPVNVIKALNFKSHEDGNTVT